MDDARFWRILARALRMIVRAIDERYGKEGTPSLE
jgi:hypothetical protein